VKNAKQQQYTPPDDVEKPMTSPLQAVYDNMEKMSAVLAQKEPPKLAR
jgi:hypothetical protein